MRSPGSWSLPTDAPVRAPLCPVYNHQDEHGVQALRNGNFGQLADLTALCNTPQSCQAGLHVSVCAHGAMTPTERLVALPFHQQPSRDLNEVVNLRPRTTACENITTSTSSYHRRRVAPYDHDGERRQEPNDDVLFGCGMLEVRKRQDRRERRTKHNLSSRAGIARCE